MKRKENAVITVYLALTLLVMLAIITVALESAKTAALGYVADSVGRMSSESVLAEFQMTLYEKYHVFGKEAGKSKNSDKRQTVEELLRTSVGKNTVSDGAFFWKFESVGIDVTDCVSLVDYDGAFFRQQAVEYMEYRGVSMAAEELLGLLDIFKKADATSELLAQKTEAEEGTAEIDRRVFELISLVDGIQCDENGIKQTLTGKIKIASSFVKRMVLEEISQETVLVNHTTLYEALEDSYENPKDYIDAALEAISSFGSLASKKSANEAEIKKLEKESAESDDFGDKLSIEAEILRLQFENIKLDVELLSYKNSYSTAINKLQKLISGCRETCSEALEVMNKINEAQNAAKPQILQYADSLFDAASWLDEDLFQDLSDGLDTLEAYLGYEVGGLDTVPDFDGMKTTLESNSEILREAEIVVESLSGTDNVAMTTSMLETLSGRIDNYSNKALYFDYSGMKLKSNGADPLKTLRNLVAEGISGLVADTGSMSQKKYDGTELPSDNTGLTVEGENTSALLTGSFAEIFKESPIAGIKELLAEGTSALAEKALFLSYLFDNFNYYSNERNDDTVCEYELEYILCGNLTDKENLCAVISKIVLVRLLFCFIHVVSDSAKRTEAKNFALSVLGFTGMPVLVAVMQYLILTLWAFDEALVETAALMKGKKVAIIPTADSFRVGMQDLLIISREYISAKADSYTDAIATGLDYKGYLMLFLLLQKETVQNLRTMDVIQENLRIDDDEFRMNRMLYGFNANFTFVLPNSFATLPFSAAKSKKYEYKLTCGARY